jgi:gamma-glutamyltranspeptidase/glutathione hydrolase
MLSTVTSRNYDAEVSAVQGFGAAVSTPHVLATQAGMEILAVGGNSADAMVAADAVLGVVAPETCGIGGDLFALIHRPEMREPAALNASGRAGSNADPDALLAQGHQRMPPFHPQSVTVPGCVDGWERLLERFGSLPLERLLAPAIRLATLGFPASFELASALRSAEKVLLSQPAAAGMYPGGMMPEVGDRLFRPGLSATLTAIGREGSRAFYHGPVAEAITEATDGIITADDLAKVGADWVEPISVDVFGSTGWTMPLNTQGYLTLASAAAFASLDPPSDPESIDSWHLAIECYRAMAADRNDVVADPDTAPQPSSHLVSADWIRERASLVDRRNASPMTPPAPRPGGTAYLCAVDAEGMGVSFIQSNFMGLGSRIGAGPAGFLLHNRGAGFDLRPGHPNRLARGRRPLHTLSPSLWTRDGRLTCLLGTRGGDYQPQLLLQMAIRLFHGGVEPGEAQARPRWVINPLDSGAPEVNVEAHTPPPVVSGLRARGHRVTQKEMLQHGWGPVSVITIDELGLRTAVADPRVNTASAAVS